MIKKKLNVCLKIRIKAQLSQEEEKICGFADLWESFCASRLCERILFVFKSQIV